LGLRKRTPGAQSGTRAHRFVSSLVRRIQYAVLGSAGPEEDRDRLRELAIPANFERRADALKKN
jgi:hypothetical protein